MATLKQIAKGVLPPVGNPISLEEQPASELVPGFRHILLQSGTAALALALKICKSNANEQQRQVIIPAYACPDLVSAIVFCGLEPVLVDLKSEDCCLDINELQSVLNGDVLAIIAVNFLGYRENIDEIKAISGVRDFGIQIIEDSAQWYPEDIGSGSLADIVCLSFGRGKPVSLLGGGMLLVKTHLPIEPELVGGLSLSEVNQLGLFTKIKLYNLLLSPFFYQFLARNPFLKLGETKYKKLQEIRRLPTKLISTIYGNVIHYFKLARDKEGFYRNSLDKLAIDPVSARCHGRLLRYPIVFMSEQERDKCCGIMEKEGLGASKMYGKVLNEFGEVIPLLSLQSREKTFPNASQLARTLLTLPLHSNVSDNRLESISKILNGFPAKRD